MKASHIFFFFAGFDIGLLMTWVFIMRPLRKLLDETLASYKEAVKEWGETITFSSEVIEKYAELLEWVTKLGPKDPK